jgi:hypothetical protein
LFFDPPSPGGQKKTMKVAVTPKASAGQMRTATKSLPAAKNTRFFLPIHRSLCLVTVCAGEESVCARPKRVFLRSVSHFPR